MNGVGKDWFIRTAKRADTLSGECQQCGRHRPLFARFGEYGPRAGVPLEREYCEACLEAEAENAYEQRYR